nr:hypothetical protein BaRGS_027056 [Batillaria attramentaria]
MNDTGDELDEKQEEELKGEQEGEKKETDDNEEEEENGDDLPVDSSDDSDISRAVTKAVKEHGVLVPVLLDKLSEWRAQVMSLAKLADISTDEESGRLATSSDLVMFVLNLLRETLGSADHTYNGWRESMEALWRLSFSKDNKARFVENEELMDLVRKVFYDRKEKDFCRVAAQGILEQVGCQLSKTLDSVPNV